MPRKTVYLSKDDKLKLDIIIEQNPHFNFSKMIRVSIERYLKRLESEFKISPTPKSNKPEPKRPMPEIYDDPRDFI